MTNPYNWPDIPGNTNFVIHEVEGESDYEGVLDWLAFGQSVHGIPDAIITNFSPFSDGGLPVPSKARPLIEAGMACLTECYLPDNPNATPGNMDLFARQLGWASSQPSFGTYGGLDLEDYDAWLDWPGWSAYLAEYII